VEGHRGHREIGDEYELQGCDHWKREERVAIGVGAEQISRYEGNRCAKACSNERAQSAVSAIRIWKRKFVAYERGEELADFFFASSS